MKKLLIAFTLFQGLAASAQWNDYQKNQPVVEIDGNQYNQLAVPNDQGGCYVLWLDDRGDLGKEQAYIQQFDSTGKPLWTENGVPLAPTRFAQRYLKAIPDGQGGVFAIWSDFRDSTGPTSRNVDIWGQHINRTGDFLWGSLGKALIREAGEQNWPLLITDDAGGFIAGFRDAGDFDAGRKSGYRAQRLDADGNEQWTKGGVLIHPMTSPFFNSQDLVICPDGQNGAYMVYSESSYNQQTAANLYGHHITANGAREWPAEMDTLLSTNIVVERGYPISKGKGNDKKPIITIDNQGNLYVAWTAKRELTWRNGALFTTKVDVSGSLVWGKEVNVASSYTNVSNFGMAYDGSDGLYYSYTSDDVSRYELVHLDTSGSQSWSPIEINDDVVHFGNLAADVKGRAFLVWNETEVNTNSQNGIVMQIVDQDGMKQLPNDEVISTYPEDKLVLHMALDGKSRAYVTWVDYRRTNGLSGSDADADILVQAYPRNINSSLQNLTYKTPLLHDDGRNLTLVNARGASDLLEIRSLIGTTVWKSEGTATNASTEALPDGVYLAHVVVDSRPYMVKFYHFGL